MKADLPTSYANKLVTAIKNCLGKDKHTKNVYWYTDDYKTYHYYFTNNYVACRLTLDSFLDTRVRQGLEAKGVPFVESRGDCEIIEKVFDQDTSHMINNIYLNPKYMMIATKLAFAIGGNLQFVGSNGTDNDKLRYAYFHSERYNWGKMDIVVSGLRWDSEASIG